MIRELLETGKYEEFLNTIANDIVNDIQRKKLSRELINILQQNYTSLKTVIVERKGEQLNKEELREAVRLLEVIENKLNPNQVRIDEDYLNILSLSPRIKNVYSPIYMGYSPLVLTVEYITMDYLNKIGSAKGNIVYKGFINPSVKEKLESICNITIENNLDMELDKAIAIDLYNRLLLVMKSETIEKDFNEIIEDSRRQVSMCRIIKDNLSDRFINEVILAKEWYDELSRKDTLRLVELGVKPGEEVTDEFIKQKWNEKLEELKENAYGEMGGEN